MPCPFCSVLQERILLESRTGLALPDAYPLCAGHTLIVSRRHVKTIYELTTEDQQDLWSLVFQVRHSLIEQYASDAFNIGINDGLNAGQTIDHAHIHVIPRRKGDVADPRGGIRWVIPDK